MISLEDELTALAILPRTEMISEGRQRIASYQATGTRAARHRAHAISLFLIHATAADIGSRSKSAPMRKAAQRHAAGALADLCRMVEAAAPAQFIDGTQQPPAAA